MISKNYLNTRSRFLFHMTAIMVFAIGPVVCAQDSKPASGDQAEQKTSAEQAPAPDDTKPADQVDSDQPAIPAATVLEVVGQAHWADAGTSPVAAEGWTPIESGNELKPGTLIRTGLRSHVNLQFGETTTVSVRSVSYASIDQFYLNATTETVRLGLGYGTVRGGSSEGEIHADVEVSAPVATLAKRGTEGWQIGVVAGTGRFRISLAEHGLVEAIQMAHGKRITSRHVRPGQYATAANIANMWIDQNIFDRNVQFFQAAFVTEADAAFMARNHGGSAGLASGGGTTLASLSGRSQGDLLRANRPTRVIGTRVPVMPIGVSGPITRPEGNFGTGGIFKLRSK